MEWKAFRVEWRLLLQQGGLNLKWNVQEAHTRIIVMCPQTSGQTMYILGVKYLHVILRGCSGMQVC